MLCVSLFMAQLVFIIGIDKIKNEVRPPPSLPVLSITPSLSHTGCLFSYSSATTISIPSVIHVDVNGGCSIICNTSESVY